MRPGLCARPAGCNALSRVTGARNDPLDVFGIFPAFAPLNPGGIQVSGRLAWDAIVAAHGPRALALQVDVTGSATNEAARACLEHSRTRAALRALRAPRSRTALCWHIDLLPLLALSRHHRGVLFLHGIESWRRPGLPTRALLPRVDLILANSAYTLSRAIEHAPVLARIRSKILPLGIGAPIECVAEPGPEPAAVMIGRLEAKERYKGHEDVIRAWPAVRSRIPNAQLWIIGEGQLRRELERRARDLRLDGAVRIYGRVDEVRKRQFLENARCLALPSLGEGFGLVYAEAMRLARPCLVSTTDAGREVVNPPECGLAADPRNQTDLVNALVRLLTPGAEWDDWSRRAHSRYAALFTAAAFQQRILHALDDA